MTIVGDASVALLWCFQLNKSDRAEKLLRSDHHLISPDLVIAEITNAAWKFVISADRASAIAVELRHPACDCFYLALAEPNTSPLVTADEKLIRRCADTPFEKLERSL
jgi:predicted nucleic acid-binding protein